MPPDAKVKPELVLPAGNMEKMRSAFRFGADAVYLGAAAFNLRAKAGNFSETELTAAVAFARQHNKKAYLLCNTFPAHDEIPALSRFIERTAPMGFHAYVVADPGVFRMVRRIAPRMPVHISTQANVTNPEAAAFWHDLGAGRIVLARELSLDQIRGVCRAVPAVSYEVFVHGAMCMALSGRCFLSNSLAGRDANRGDCAQPCRWEYRLWEKTRPDTPLSAVYDGRYTTVLSARDLNLSHYLGELAAAGVSAFKIEGRMKSLYYAAVTARVYRHIIDNESPDWAWVDRELDSFSHREYGTGFLRGTPEQTAEGYTGRYRFMARITAADPDRGRYSLRLFNPLRQGRRLEAVTPRREATLTSYTLLTETETPVDLLPHQQGGFLVTAERLDEGDLLREAL